MPIKTLDRIARWREICPDIAIRSTFIVGYPGETEEDFQILLDWLDEAKIERAGCFKYEPVKGARSEALGTSGCTEEIKDIALAPLHGAPAGPYRRADGEEGRQAP